MQTEQGFSFFVFVFQNGETALHKAAQMGHVEEVKMLIDYGAAVNIRDKVFELSILSINRHCKLWSIHILYHRIIMI